MCACICGVARVCRVVCGVGGAGCGCGIVVCVGACRNLAPVLGRDLLSRCLEVPAVGQVHFDAAQDRLTGFVDALEALAMAREDLDAEFLFQFDDGLGHARLRGVQRLGCLGQVQVASRCFLHEAELMQIHIAFLQKQKFIMQ